MNKKKRKHIILLIVGATICIIALIIILIIFNMQYISQTNVDSAKRFEIGDIIVLEENEKELLKEKTIEHIKNSLKAPTTAKFEEGLEYICNEENIIKIKGYVDSQNSFGTVIRNKFICEYFAIDTIIDALVYLKIDDAEVLNIKDTYIEEYKKQIELENIKSTGNELNQEKLDYIMNEFNNDEVNDIAKITNVVFNKEESTIEVRIIAKSSGFDSVSENYWIDFNICSIMEYLKNFNIINKLKIKLVDRDKTVEVIFDDNFLKNEWKENHKINLVKEIFGENYKEILQ